MINRQLGVGLIEVLAALFVLSVGLLGIAGLQAQGLIAGFNASQRSVAVVKAYEIIEDIMKASLELIDRCPCASGCPSCVGSPLPPHASLDPDVNMRGLIPDKEAARSILHHLLLLDPYQPAPRPAAGSAEVLKQEAELREMLDATRLPVPLEKKLRERVDRLRTRRPRPR